MNILFLTTHANTGGITSYLLTLAKGLIREGHRVYVISSGGNQQDDFTWLGAEHITIDIKTKTELSPKLCFALGKIKNIIKEKNIHIIHSHTRVTQVIGGLLQKMTGKQYLSTCHGFFKTRLSRRLFPFWGDAVIAISPPVREHLEKDFKIDLKKIALIPNGVEVDKFAPFREDYRKEKRRLFSLEGYEIIGIIARLSDVKGHDVLINAMTKIARARPSSRLLIVGAGKEDENLREMVSQLHLNDFVHFYPVINKTADFLPIFDVFVMPSLQEGLGLSVMEAQSTALPVVASNVGGLPTLIEHGKTGLLVPPQDSDALAAAIIDLLSDRAKAVAMGKAAREFIIAKFSADTMVKKTVEIYEKLQGKGR